MDILLLLLALPLGLPVEGTLVEFPAADDVGDGSGDKKERPRAPITHDECRRTAAAAAAKRPLGSGMANELVEWRLNFDTEGSEGGKSELPTPCAC